MKALWNKIKLIFDNISGPFRVIGAYWYVLLWWIIIIVTLMGPIVDAAIQKEARFIYFINSGALYYSVITLLFSFVITNLIDLSFGPIYDQEKEIPFLPYQIVTIALSVLYMLILMVLYICFRGNPLVQIILSVIGYVFSFYMYCVSYMHRVKEDLSQYSISYDEEKKKNSKKIQKNAKNKTSDGLDLYGGKKK